MDLSLFRSFFQTPQFNHSAALLMHFKARYPVMMTEEIITGMKVKHIMVVMKVMSHLGTSVHFKGRD